MVAYYTLIDGGARAGPPASNSLLRSSLHSYGFSVRIIDAWLKTAQTIYSMAQKQNKKRKVTVTEVHGMQTL